jgi:hypothetical protein
LFGQSLPDAAEAASAAGWRVRVALVPDEPPPAADELVVSAPYGSVVEVR